jgi:hypothetical protein
MSWAAAQKRMEAARNPMKTLRQYPERPSHRPHAHWPDIVAMLQQGQYVELGCSAIYLHF